MADVPQLTLENAKYYQSIKSILFPNLSDEEIKNNFNYRLNVLDLIKKEQYIPNATLIFDAGELDIQEHYTPFFEELNKITGCSDNRMKIIINPINEHKFLSMEESLEIIQQSCDNNLMCFGDELYDSKIYNDLKILEKQYEENNTAKDKEIENLKHQIKEITTTKDQEIAKLEKQKSEITTAKDQEIQNLNTKNNELNRKFEEISTSTIWKMTKPLRKFLDLFK